MTDAAIIYRSHVEAIENLPAEQQLEAYKALIAYCMDDEEPDGGVSGLVVGMAKPMLDKWKAKREAGAKGGSNCKQTEATEKQTEAKEKEKVKVKDKKERDTIVSPKKSSRFSAPSADQVKDYCSERGNGIDAQSFIDFYQRQNWRLSNGVKMSDWKAAVRTWEKRRNDKNTYNNHPEQRKEYGGEIDWTGL